MANLYTLLKADVKQIRKLITNELKDNGYEPIVADKYIYAEGTIPVLLVAHYDTVFDAPPKYIKNKGGVLSAKKGLGADDRAGVYGILTLCKKHHCHMLFVDEEETGCKGSIAFTKDFKELPINYMIELDRRGTNDSVYYDGDSPDFEKFIDSFGWKTALGSCTDICYLAPHFGVMGVNLSIGYENEHCANETLDTDAMNKTINRVGKMLDGDKFEWKEMERGWLYKNGYFGYGRYGYDPYDYDLYNEYLMREYYIEFADSPLDSSEMDSDIVYATSKEEAIGVFLIDHPSLCYNDVACVLDEAELAEEYFG